MNPKEHPSPNKPSMLPEAQALINRSLAQIAEGRAPIILSTTQLALARGAGGDNNSYILGTAQERAYIRLKTTIKETNIDIEDYDFNEGISGINLDQMPPASTAPATSTYTELSTGQFIEVDYAFK
jgi:hypothetical protein